VRPDRDDPGEFRLRSMAFAAYAPATLFGLAQGAILPVIVASSFARGASAAAAAFVGALIGIGSLVTNIPSGILATRLGERRAMLIAALITAAGLILCLVDLGRSSWSLAVYGTGVLLIGGASSIYNLARQAYLTEMVPLHMRARAMSALGGWMRVGIFAGPFLGAAAIGLVGIPGAYYVSLMATLVAAGIVYRVPDLDLSEEHRQASAGVTTLGVIRSHWRLFLTLGTGVLLLQAIRQSRQGVIPLWASHIGLSPTDASIIYGIAGAIDALTFYPAGRVMDVRGRRWVAIPSVLIMALALLLMPLTHGMLALVLVSVLLGFGNGIGSGIVMTLAADVSPSVGRLTFLGVWRELSDGGAALGPMILSAATGLAGLGFGIVVSGGIGLAAAAALWAWIPRTHGETGEPAGRLQTGPGDRVLSG
jgi:MFS family permease